MTDDASSTAAPSAADGVVNADMTMRYGSVDPEYAERLASTPPDQDGPVWMVNLMRYRERAEYADGRSTDLTGQQADDLYAPFDSLAAVGAEIVFFGEVETQLLGDGPAWDRIAVVKYPTGRAFVPEAALLGHPAGSHVAWMDDEPDPVHAFGLEQVAHQHRDCFGCYAFPP